MQSIRRDGDQYIVELKAQVPDQSRYDFRRGQLVTFSRQGQLESAHSAGDAVAFHNPILETILTTQLTSRVSASATAFLIHRSSLYRVGDTVVFSPTISRVITAITNLSDDMDSISFTPALGQVFQNNHEISIQSFAHSIVVETGTTDSAFTSAGSSLSNITIAKTESIHAGDVIHFPDHVIDERYFLITSVRQTEASTIITAETNNLAVLPPAGSAYEIRHYLRSLGHVGTLQTAVLVNGNELQISATSLPGSGDTILIGYEQFTATQVATLNSRTTIFLAGTLERGYSIGTEVSVLKPYGFVYDNVTPSSFSDEQVGDATTITIDDAANHVGELALAVANDLNGLALRIEHDSSSAEDAVVSFLGGVAFPDWNAVATAISGTISFDGVTTVRAGEGLGGGGSGSIVSLHVTRPVPADGSPGQILTIQDDGTLGWGAAINLNTNDTIEGDGTDDNPYRVATPYTETEKTKLGGIEIGATQDQTASEIRDLLAGLVGNNRLSAEAIRGLIKTYRGDWSSGVAVAKGDVFTNSENHIFFALNAIASSTTSPESDTTNFVRLDGGIGLTAAGLAALIEGSTDDHSRLKGTEDFVLADSATELEKISASDIRAYIQAGIPLSGDRDLNSVQGHGFYYAGTDVLNSVTLTNQPEGTTVGAVLVGEAARNEGTASRIFQIAFTINSDGSLTLYKRVQTTAAGDWGAWEILVPTTETDFATAINDAREDLTPDDEKLVLGDGSSISSIPVTDFKHAVFEGLANLPNNSNLNTIQHYGIYNLPVSVDNAPSLMSAGYLIFGSVNNTTGSGNRHFQLIIGTISDEFRMFQRISTNSNIGTSTTNPPAWGSWSEFGAGGGGGSNLSAGTWATGQNYVLHQIVSVASNVYIARSANTSDIRNSPTAGGQNTWFQIGRDPHVPEWTNSKAYTFGDLVIDTSTAGADNVYVLRSDNILASPSHTAPNTDTTNWKFVGGAGSGIANLLGVHGGSAINVAHSPDGQTATISIPATTQDRFMPEGGEPGQALTKVSGNNYSVDWVTPGIESEQVTEAKLDASNDPIAGYVLGINPSDLNQFTWVAQASGGASEQDITVIQSGNLAFSVADHLGNLIDARNGTNRSISITLPDTADLDSRDLTKVCDIYVRTGVGGGAVSVLASVSRQLNAVNPYRAINYTQDIIYLGNSTATAGGGLYTIYARAGSYLIFGAVRENLGDNLVPIPHQQIEKAFFFVDNGGTIEPSFGYEVMFMAYKNQTGLGHANDRWVFANLDEIFRLASVTIGTDPNTQEHNYSLEFKDGVIKKSSIRATTDLDNLIGTMFVQYPTPANLNEILVNSRTFTGGGSGWYVEDATNTIFPLTANQAKFTIERDLNPTQRDIISIMIRAGRATGITDSSLSSAIVAATTNENNIYQTINIPVQVGFQVSGTIASASTHYHILFAAGVHAYIRVTSEETGDTRVQVLVSNTTNSFNGNEFVSFYAVRGIGG